MKFLGFVATFLFIFVLSVIFLAAVDSLPEAPESKEPTTQGLVVKTPATIPSDTSEPPVRVVAASVGMDVAVLNTQSSDIAALDADLLKGAVRYPGSAMLGEDGTVLLFGHSSYLPIVRNQNYKAFNNIQKLKEGDIVSVYSGAREYRYAVTEVRLANAEEDVVELRSDGKYLALVTCNTFAAKTARFIVTAKLDGVSELH